MDQSLGKNVIAAEDRATVLLDVEHVLLVQLKVILRVVAQVARLPDDLRGHLVRHKLLPCVEGHKRCECRQP